jgi:hypothetical protein
MRWRARLPIFKREEVDALSLPTIESWVPPAIIETALRLHRMFAAENKSDGLAALSRLISDPRMKVVWRELYKKKRYNHQATEEFLHPARVTNASRATICRQKANELLKLGGSANELEARLLEDDAATLEKSEDLMPMDPRWSEQDQRRRTSPATTGGWRHGFDGPGPAGAIDCRRVPRKRFGPHAYLRRDQGWKIGSPEVRPADPDPETGSAEMAQHSASRGNGSELGH